MKFTVLVNPNVTQVKEVIKKCCRCDMLECAWWDEYFGKCTIAVSSYLRGIEEHRLEVKQVMGDRD